MKFTLLSILLTVFVACKYVEGWEHFKLEHPEHLKFLKAIVKLHMGATKPPIDDGVPADFKDHPGTIVTKDPVSVCNYATNVCTFSDTNADLEWKAYVNNDTAVVDGPVNLDGNPELLVFHIISQELVGTRCLFFKFYSSTDDISFAISLIHGNDESTTPVPGGRVTTKRITIGVGIDDKPYRVVIRVYSAGKDKETGGVTRPTDGVAIIGKLTFVDGPCVTDQKSLNCSFDHTICHWKLHDTKYIWYPMPFGKDHHIPHKIEFGALAAFGHNAGMWSPVVKSLAVRCFTFIYAKGVSEESFLRVWLLVKVPGGGNQRVLLYEDITFHKVIKKVIQINIFVPFHFQIAFEGQSKTILHGVVVLDTAISPHSCKGLGLMSDVRNVQFAPTGSGAFTIVPKTTTP